MCRDEVETRAAQSCFPESQRSKARSHPRRLPRESNGIRARANKKAREHCQSTVRLHLKKLRLDFAIIQHARTDCII